MEKTDCFAFVGHITRTTYVDVVYCYWPSSVVCWSVSHTVCHTREPCKNGRSDQDSVWVEDSGGPREPCVTWGVQIPHGKGQFLGGVASHCEI